VIDDEEIEFPTIHFERKVWVGISPFNCWRRSARCCTWMQFHYTPLSLVSLFVRSKKRG
jgi:hypothetical protein